MVVMGELGLDGSIRDAQQFMFIQLSPRTVAKNMISGVETVLGTAQTKNPSKTNGSPIPMGLS